MFSPGIWRGQFQRLAPKVHLEMWLQGSTQFNFTSIKIWSNVLVLLPCLQQTEFYANSTLPKVTGMLVKADLGPPRLILAGPLLSFSATKSYLWSQGFSVTLLQQAVIWSRNNVCPLSWILDSSRNSSIGEYQNSSIYVPEIGRPETETVP